ncbi:MAG: efflux RND transporter periplasmic adaptor subunit [Tannerella sp.]|jgi:membrane fusion protein (multidrug efflux system)|nr:efflux RND transporter periplasmic adaptor subunit [Tannerella sp.]
MTKPVKWSIMGIIALTIIGLLVYPQLKQQENTGKAVTPASGTSFARQRQALNINAIVLRQQELTDMGRAIGSTLPDEEVNLSFESSGKIVAIYFKEGTHVKKGELLAKINDKPLQAELKKLEAQVQLAKDRVFRQGTLLEKDAVSQEAYEQVTTEYEKLMADIELVKAHIAQTELCAPFDGIVGLRLVSEGAYVTPATVIVNLTKISPLKIEFSINEYYATDVFDGTNITFYMQNTDGKEQKYNATVYAVESEIEPKTHTLKARAIFPNENEAIKPGRYVSVEIKKREIKNAIVVPSEAVIPEMGKSIVYKYSDGEAQPVEIIRGLRTADMVQILGGLQLGDTVITTGVMQLRAGLPVIIDNLQKE